MTSQREIDKRNVQLRRAIADHDATLAYALADQGASINSTVGEMQIAPVLTWVEKQDAAAFKIALELGADLNVVSFRGAPHTPLELMVRQGWEEGLQLVADKYSRERVRKWLGMPLSVAPDLKRANNTTFPYYSIVVFSPSSAIASLAQEELEQGVQIESLWRQAVISTARYGQVYLQRLLACPELPGNDTLGEAMGRYLSAASLAPPSAAFAARLDREYSDPTHRSASPAMLEAMLLHSRNHKQLFQNIQKRVPSLFAQMHHERERMLSGALLHERRGKSGAFKTLREALGVSAGQHGTLWRVAPSRYWMELALKAQNVELIEQCLEAGLDPNQERFDDGGGIYASAIERIVRGFSNTEKAVRAIEALERFGAKSDWLGNSPERLSAAIRKDNLLDLLSARAQTKVLEKAVSPAKAPRPGRM